VKYEGYGKEGNFLFIRGEFRPRYGSETDFMFNVNDMMLLSEVREKFLKGLEIKIPVEQVASLNLDALDSVMTRFPGKQNLRFRFIDPAEPMEADAVSRRQVEPSEEFCRAMKEEVGLEVNFV
jgi:DNA polymerase III subunit alpha